VRFALNADKELDATAIGIYEALWLEGFSDLPDACLIAAFQKTLRTAKFWPIKIADGREHVSSAASRSTDEAAEQAWQRVLEIRRTSWSPDAPGGFYGGPPRLSPRIAQAARAAGVWRDFPTTEALHVWAKKVFFESFLAWGEREQEKFLLPDGEVKNLLARFAETKALPAPEVCFQELHERGLAYAEVLTEENAWGEPKKSLPLVDKEKRREIEAELADYGKRQAAILAELNGEAR